jgi:hypothetical protein
VEGAQCSGGAPQKMPKRQLDAFLVDVCFHPKTARALPGRRAVIDIAQTLPIF